MADARTSVRDVYSQFTRFDGGPVGPCQRAHLRAEGPVRRIPEIEVPGKLAERPIGQDIIPPRIELRSGHVVGHDIQEDAQSVPARAVDEVRPGGLAAQVVAGDARYPQGPTEEDTLRLRAIEAQRQTLTVLRDRGQISDEAYHRLEEEIDWAELNAAPVGTDARP